MASPTKFLIPVTLAVGTIFAALITPLAFYGSQPLKIQLRGEEVFEGQLREIATPYLTFAGVLSLGATAASMALLGWRRTARQSKELEQQLAKVEQQFKLKEAQLQETRLSENYLRDSGLQFFLENDAPIVQLQTAQPAAEVPSRGQASQLVTQPVPLTAVSATDIAISTAKTQVANRGAILPSQAAQAVLSFTRSTVPTVHVQAEVATLHSVTPSILRSLAEPIAASRNSTEIAQIQELHSQLQQILTQVEGLQTSLQENPQSASGQLNLPTVETKLPELTNRLQNINSSRAIRTIAS